MVPRLPLRILTADPATGHCGWSLIVLKSLSPLAVSVEARGTLDGNKLLKKKNELSKIFQRQFCILDAIYDEFCGLIAEHKPDVVVSEGAFGGTIMSALISLTLVIHQIRRATCDTLGIDLVIVPPTITKRAFAEHGSADKDRMRAAYETLPYLDRGDTSIPITEHEIDAIGHGIGYIRRDLIGDVIQISALEKKRMKREKQKQKEKEKQE